MSNVASLSPGRIALIGFMGCGKTTVGKLLASRLNGEFVDTDALIEQASGKTIPVLFREEGEPGFRDREEQAVEAACAGEARVIATGGGVVVRPANIARLRSSAFVVWLTARPDIILARTGRDGGGRPLLTDSSATASPCLGEDPLMRVLRLLGERGPLYQQAADLIVDTTDRLPNAIAAEILRKFERRYEQ